MELRDIRYFNVVAERKNIGRSTRRLTAILKVQAKEIGSEGVALSRRFALRGATSQAHARGA